MRRGGTSVALRLGLLVICLCLTVVAVALAAALAAPLRGEPGERAATTVSSKPTAVERPVAIAKGFENSQPPNIRPEPAVSPETRALKLRIAREKKAEQQRARQREVQRQRAEQRKAEQRRAEQRRAEQRRLERLRAERLEAERKKAERQRIERQKAEAEREEARLTAAREVRSLPAEASGRSPAGQAGQAGPAPRDGKMSLSINRIGLRNSPIETSDEQRVLDRGLMHLPQTSRPWERGKARNVYVVGHRMGWPNTRSWKIFYRLDELQPNDRLVLKAGGETYRYKVTEKFVVTPWDVWVTNPVKGRDLLTLQTCTGPDFSQRLIIRADRV